MSTMPAAGEVGRALADLQRRTLRALFRWVIVVIPGLALVFLLAYLEHREAAALTLACAFGGFALSQPVAWRALAHDRPMQAQHMFLAGASLLVAAYLLLMPASLVLVGVMGLFLFIRLTTAFDPTRATALGIAWFLLFVLAFIGRRDLGARADSPRRSGDAGRDRAAGGGAAAVHVGR